MKNYYADFLQTINFENIPGKAVSKVSKGQKSDSKTAFDTFDTAPPSINQKIEFSSSGLNSALTKADETKATTLIGKINLMIAAGASFNVTADDFQVGAGNLLEAEKQFLYANKPQILCILQ